MREKRLRTKAIARAAFAPEIERFLSRDSVDLRVTDQTEALKVRIEKGLEIIARKTANGIQAAGRRIAFLSILAFSGILVAGFHSAALCTGRLAAMGRGSMLILTAFAALLLAAATVALGGAAKASRDRASLSRFKHRYARSLDKACSSEELLELADGALSRARELGIVPEKHGPEKHGPEKHGS